MKNKLLVSGSLAFDHVMSYDGHFKDVILPSSYTISVTADSRFINYGGCGGNICYNLSLFGEKPVLLAVAGYDFAEYKMQLEKYGVDLSQLFESKEYPTASAFIITDTEGNQITVFEPGVMKAVENHVSVKNVDADEISWAIIAPDTPFRMERLAKECAELGISYIFDPGQQIANFKPDVLMECAKQAKILIINEYEADLMAKIFKMPKQDLHGLSQIYIETHGENGGIVMADGKITQYAAVKATKVEDPTGCGDAFRAGVMAGLNKGLDYLKSCQIGAVCATYSIESPATQIHKFTKEEFDRRFAATFGDDPGW